MEKPTISLFVFSFSLLFISFLCVDCFILNLDELGAIGDGKTDSTEAFLKAWFAACSSHSPTTIYVPRKRYLVGPTVFGGPCNNTGITVKMEGLLLSPDYRTMKVTDKWLTFQDVTGVTLAGGYLNGRGSQLWACKATSKTCPDGTVTLSFYNSRNIVISKMTSIDSEKEHFTIYGSENVKIEGVKIVNSDNGPNTDGIHIQNSNNIQVFSTSIATGDDCISIGPGSRHLWIETVACGPGHGISIGSLAKEAIEDAVQNITVKSVVFNATQNGLRIKTWARPSNGSVTKIVFNNATMINVENPIIIDQHYCPHNDKCPGQDSGVKITRVHFKNIRGTSATKEAVKFDCSKSSPCEKIKLHNIKLKYAGDQPAQSFCRNAYGVSEGVVEPPSCL